MRFLESIKTRLRSLLFRRSVEAELDEELRSHIEREIGFRISQGEPAHSARRQTLLEFGGIDAMKEDCRDARGLQLFYELSQDLRYGIRALFRVPAFFLTAVLTLALGVGAITAVFSIVHGVLIKPLPYADSDRLVALWMTPPAGATEATNTGSQPPSSQRRRTSWEGNIDGGRNGPELAPADFVDIRQQITSLDLVVAADPYSYTLTGDHEPVNLRAFNVSRGFFELTGVQPLYGRTFSADEYSTTSNTRVVVLSHWSWKQKFGANPLIAGTTIRLNGQPHVVAGVMPPAFQLPVGGYYSTVDLWAPMEKSDSWSNRSSAYWPVMARLAPGANRMQAQQELDLFGARLAKQYPDTNRTRRFRAIPLREHLVGTLRPVLLMLFGAVSLLMMIGCANVAGLLLVRGAGRRREFDVRTALGASPARIARQLIVENCLLAGAGTVLGVGLAYAIVPVLLAMTPVTSPLLSEITIDGPVLFFVVGIAVMTAAVFGLGPALSFARSAAARKLDLGSRSLGDNRGRRRIRAALVVAQIALSVTLLAGAGLLVRTLANLLGIDPGFRTINILSAQVSPFGFATTDAQSRELIARVMTGIEQLPGVIGTAAVSNLPLHETPVDYRDRFTIDGRPRIPGEAAAQALHTIVTNNYFDVMAIGLRAGRIFNQFDTADSARVVLISEGMARRYWQGQNAIGAKVTLGYPANGTATVIGIVEDVKHNRPDADPEPEVYMPHAQVPSRLMTFVVRAENASQLAGPLRNILHEAIPGLPLGQIATIESFRYESFRAERFSTFLLSALAVMAVVLASIGLFGVISYSVATQRREIALRMALGAKRTEVIWHVLRYGLTLAGLGVLLGVGGGLLTTRLLSALLYGICVTDPMTYAGICVLTILLALAACLFPAHRASSVDPAVALRAE